VASTQAFPSPPQSSHLARPASLSIPSHPIRPSVNPIIHLWFASPDTQVTESLRVYLVKSTRVSARPGNGLALWSWSASILPWRTTLWPSLCSALPWRPTHARPAESLLACDTGALGKRRTDTSGNRAKLRSLPRRLRTQRGAGFS
jgi:hypothetical protein